jgi:SET domain-containing protein
MITAEEGSWMKGKIEVRLSQLSGRGVFATEPIQEGEQVGRFIGKRTTTNGPHVCWMKFDGEWRGYQGRGRLRFLNHANSPNSEFIGLDLYALRVILSGEEVTIDYGDEYEWDDEHRMVV